MLSSTPPPPAKDKIKNNLRQRERWIWDKAKSWLKDKIDVGSFAGTVKGENLWQRPNNYHWGEKSHHYPHWVVREKSMWILTSIRLLRSLNYGVSDHQKEMDSHLCCWILIHTCYRKWRQNWPRSKDFGLAATWIIPMLKNKQLAVG